MALGKGGRWELRRQEKENGEGIMSLKWGMYITLGKEGVRGDVGVGRGEDAA